MKSDLRLARSPVGAHVAPGEGVHFRVWAPRRKRVEVVIDGGETVRLEPEPGGHHAGLVAGIGAGARYRYRLDGGDAYPDPASRYQPEGPHGPSEVVDPTTFSWTDQGWKGLQLPGQVIYELHIGTFTTEGTWEWAARDLPRLAELGITAVEVMPVAEFAGDFGWGYDGVDLFAPYHIYGRPDDFRRFVDRAHALGLGVILDVVYNHLGPDGAYHHQFCEDYYNSARPKTDWGDPINFDGPGCEAVRAFYVANAGYWIGEYHIDGLRLDAAQAILDDSPDYILAEAARHARAVAREGGRSIIIVAEDEAQVTRRVRHPDRGGHGLDGLWNDDFHHSAIVAMTGRSEAYYSDFQGTPQELISALRWGYLFQGQYFKWQNKRRGSYAFDLDSKHFITYLENHDQVSNSARGDRLHRLTSPGRHKAMTAVLLLAPGTPMLFQGQEFNASNPFAYFADHVDDLAEKVKKGRMEFLAQFRSIAHPSMQLYLPDPGDPETFRKAKLDPAEREANPEVVLFHRDLIRLRQQDPVFRSQRGDRMYGAVIGPEAFVLRFFGAEDDLYDDRLLVVNLGRDLFPNPTSEPLLAPPEGALWEILWNSEDPRYGGCGAPPVDTDDHWRIPGHATIVLGPKRT
jgi:maltooligosyltrehalose trehalohydrolase